LRHTLIYTLARVVPGFINFIALLLYTRLLEPSDYGIYAIILSIVALLDVLFFKWINTSVIRLGPGYKDNENIFISTIIGCFVYVVLISIFLIPFAIILVPSKYQSYLLLSLLYFWAQAWGTLNLEITRSKLKPNIYSLMYLIRSTTSVIISVLLIYLGFGVKALFIGLILANIFSSFINAKYWLLFKVKAIQNSIITEVFRYGFPLSISAGLAIIIDSSDRFLLGLLGSENLVGIYSVTYDLIQRTIGVLLVIVNTSTLPIIINFYEDKQSKKLDIAIKNTLRLLLILGLPAVAGITVLSESITNVLLGENFSNQNKWLMPIIAFAILFSCIKAYYFNISFHLKRRTRIQLRISLLGAICNVVLNFILIPMYGMIGAALATLISFFLIMVITWYVGKSLFSLPIPYVDTLKITLSTIIMVFILSYISSGVDLIGLIIEILLGITIYFSCLFLFNVSGVRLIIINSIKRLLVKKRGGTDV